MTSLGCRGQPAMQRLVGRSVLAGWPRSGTSRGPSSAGSSSLPAWAHEWRPEVRSRLALALAEERLGEAIRLYQAGQSLRSVGLVLGVHATTVRSYLLKAGVKPRGH